jgi:hypothetical protein
VLLCGFPPYEGTQGANGRPDYPKTLSKIQQRCDADGRFDYFPDPYWSSISKSAQDLIRSMVLFPPLKFSFFFLALFFTIFANLSPLISFTPSFTLLLLISLICRSYSIQPSASQLMRASSTPG